MNMFTTNNIHRTASVAMICHGMASITKQTKTDETSFPSVFVCFFYPLFRISPALIMPQAILSPESPDGWDVKSSLFA